MTNRRRFHPDFAIDIQIASRHYDGISANLGNQFRDRVRERLEILTENPELFATIHGAIRAVRIPRFPYVILYAIGDDHVYYIAFVLGSADRKHWFDRK